MLRVLLTLALGQGAAVAVAVGGHAGGVTDHSNTLANCQSQQTTLSTDAHFLAMRKDAVRSLVQYAKANGDNSLFGKQVLCVKAFKSQVVSGMAYTITADIASSTCTPAALDTAAAAETDLKLCPAKGGAAIKTCTWKVWSQPWMPNSFHIPALATDTCTTWAKPCVACPGKSVCQIACKAGGKVPGGAAGSGSGSAAAK